MLKQTEKQHKKGVGINNLKFKIYGGRSNKSSSFH